MAQLTVVEGVCRCRFHVGVRCLGVLGSWGGCEWAATGHWSQRREAVAMSRGGACGGRVVVAGGIYSLCKRRAGEAQRIKSVWLTVLGLR